MLMLEEIVRFKSQNYNDLKKQQLNRGVKFVDDEFPLEAMHIDFADTSTSPLELLRPPDISESPSMCRPDSYFSLKKGFVQNFNILLAFVSLKHMAKLWSKVILNVKSQDWNINHINEHPGIFRFRFWQDGMTMEVVIDDLLPCQNRKLACLSSSCCNEFWPALLEKAYAKLLGGYDKLEHVRLEEVIMDLTGGVTESIGLHALGSAPDMKKVEFFEKIEQALNNESMILFCTKSADTESAPNSVDTSVPLESTLDIFGAPNTQKPVPDKETGLCYNYGYLLTRVRAVPKDVTLFGAFKDAFRRPGDCPIRTRLLRLQCPLAVIDGGSGLGEWKGAYSSSSVEWEEIALDARRRLGLCFSSEAEFWIPLDDVLKYMSGVVLCHIPDTSLVNLTGRTWQLNEHHGAWHGHQTGGSIQFRNSFLFNPQYYFDIISETSEVLIALIRKYDRDPLTLAVESELNPVTIGLGLFKVENNRPVRIHALCFCQTIHVEPTRPYRVCFVRSRLYPGRYVVIPFLEQPLSTAAYLLRLYLPKRTESKEYTMDIPYNPFWNFFFGTPKEAVRLTIYSAANLLWPDGKNPPSPYCVINSEDNQQRTLTCKSNNNPIWNETFIFYRRRPQKVPIVIEILDKRTLSADVFLGRHSFKDVEIAQRNQQEVVLFGRDTKEERFQRMKGSLFVEFYAVTSEEFMNI